MTLQVMKPSSCIQMYATDALSTTTKLAWAVHE
jgi:hypothetical protein